MKFVKRNKGYLILVISLLTLLLAGCGRAMAKGNGSGNATEEDSSEGKIKVVTMIFPEYDWVRSIIGEKADRFDLTCLTAHGVDIHSYQPSVGDMVKISESDLFLYVGGESDSWAKGATYTMVNENNISIALMDLMGDRLKEEEIVEGMQAEEEEEEESDEPEYDEHVWLSLTNAKVFVNAIAEALMELDPENADYYRENLEAYQQELEDLDAKYRETIASAEKDTLVFGDRFPFRYLADDYGLKYYAAFVGCSAETEASFETVVFLANKLDELGLRYIMIIERTDDSLAQSIIANTRTQNYSLAQLNSMQSILPEDFESQTSYLSIMEDNLEVLAEVLN